MTIGIVGLGHLGKIHLKLLSESQEFTVSAIFDIDQTVINHYSHQYGIKACRNYDELLQLCDAVCIVTPTPTHFDLASKAIKQGKHVFIEKPATHDVEDTKKLIRLVREANVVVQVGHVERFNPGFVSAKEFIIRPYYFEVHRLACYNVRGTDVSVVLDLMIHDIDILLSLVKSNIKRISATGAILISKTADLVNARIEFENGCVANLTANRVALHNIRTFRVFQKDAYIAIDFLNKNTTINTIQPLTSKSEGVMIDTGDGKPKYEIGKHQPITQPTNAIKHELECFYKSIHQNVPVAVSLTDAENALTVAKEIESQVNTSLAGSK